MCIRTRSQYLYFCGNFSMLMKKYRTILRIIAHILFWILFVFYFVRNNVVRPFPALHPYKEWVIVILLMVSCYLTYWFVVPRYYLSGFWKKFYVSFFLLVTLLTLAEFFLLYVDFKMFVPIVHSYVKLYYGRWIFGMLIRNTCLLMLFFILRTNEHYHDLLRMQQRASIYEDSLYHILVGKNEVKTVKISDIVYLAHQKNYTYFHLRNGEKYSMYVSMSKVEEELPSAMFRRINRNIIVNMDNVVETDRNVITLDFREKGSDNNVSFSLSSAYYS